MSAALPPGTRESERAFCALCGRPMAPDQEWCTECGAARTRILRAPDWRLPIAVIAAVIVIVAGLLALAISELAGSAGDVTVVETTAGPRAAAGPAPWPPGLDGWTVILSADPSQALATRAASRLLHAHVAGIGVLDTRQHPEMTGPPAWEVFAGRYPSYADAASAATGLVRHGQPGARPALVQRPGQG